jgi:hypothetical protein
MMNGIPLIVLVFVAMVTLLAFWRQVLMILAAALLTVLALGVIDVVTWVSAVR